MSEPIRLAPPAVEPVGVAEMRGYLRLDDDIDADAGSNEDALVAGLIAAARAALEDLTRRVIVESRWRVVLGAWPADPVAVPLAPLRTVLALAPLGTDGSLGAAFPAGLVRLDPIAGDPPCLLFADPPGGLDPGAPVALDLLAGDAPGAVPPPLVEAVRRLVARWFEERGDGEAGALPPDVLALAAPYRRLRL